MYKIKLELGKYPIFETIYVLLEQELQIVRDYLKENLKKDFIRELKSLVEYLILFILKKDGSLRLYVDFLRVIN